ncbi:MAG: hypothetical protein Q9O74_05855, partial [Planctomycetota bacterium]|nr:hypothetical protein [Planctomycetota bacterium]
MFTGIIRATGRVVGVERVAAGVRLRVEPEGTPGSPGGTPGSPGGTPRPGDSICVSGCCLTVADRGTGSQPVYVAPASSRCADGVLAFDVVPETLARTTLGGLEPGDVVHLEPSVTASTLLDGHVVQGHVEGVGVVVGVGVGVGGEYRIRIAPPAGLMPCLVPKGSVAVDGVSLTIAAVSPVAPASTPVAPASSPVAPASSRCPTANPPVAPASSPVAPASSRCTAANPPVAPASSRCPAAGGADGGWFEVALIPTTLELTTLGGLVVGSRVNLETDILARTVVHVLRHYGVGPGAG